MSGRHDICVMICVAVAITTYNRPDMLLKLLEDIYRHKSRIQLKLLIYNDLSTADYSACVDYLNSHFEDFEFHTTDDHRGKACFWETINDIYQRLTNVSFDFYIQLPDDVTLCHDFFNVAIRQFRALPDKDRICLSLINDHRSKMVVWVPVQPKEVTFKGIKFIRAGSVDGLFIAGRKFFEILRHTINPVDPEWSKAKGKSSGVGMQVSKRLYSEGYPIFHVSCSLIYHGDHASVMHPELRKKQPLISNNMHCTQIKYNGTQINCFSHDDHIGRVIEKTGTFYELAMLKFIEQNIPHSGTYIDVGANIGNHTLFFAKFCAEKVIAIEPVESNFNILQKNITENGLQKKVKLVQAAADVSSKNNYSSKSVPDNMGMCHLIQGGDIPSIRLDKLDTGGPVTLIKIDCEGMDYEVLKGAGGIIERDHPAIFIEAGTDKELSKIKAVLEIFDYDYVQRFNATPTHYFKHKQAQVSKPDRVIASMASMPSRIGSLQETIDSIINQVDRVYVYLNDYNDVPQFLLHPKIVVQRSQDLHGDIGDVGKFIIPLDFSGYHLTLDDDLVYSPDYVSTIIKAIDSLDKKAVISFHGRTFHKLPVRNYYHADADYYRCLDRVISTVPIHVPGTGVMGYHTDLVRFTPELFTVSNMADIIVGKICQQHSIPVYVIRHEKGAVKDSKSYDHAHSIYSFCKNSDNAQRDMVNSIQWKLFILNL